MFDYPLQNSGFVLPVVVDQHPQTDVFLGQSSETPPPSNK